jgi:hypothetical protein
MALKRTEDPSDANGGFLREDALFVVVVITDEDDCSRVDDNFTVGAKTCHEAPAQHNLVDLEEYRNMFIDTFGGSTYPITCPGSSATEDGAIKARRLQDFVENYVNDGPAKNGLFSDICTTNLADSLQQALDKMDVACKNFSPVY